MNRCLTILTGLPFLLPILAHAACVADLPAPTEQQVAGEQKVLRTFSPYVSTQISTELKSSKSADDKKAALKNAIYRNPYLETRMTTPTLNALVDDLMAGEAAQDVAMTLSKCLALKSTKDASYIKQFVTPHQAAKKINLEDSALVQKTSSKHLDIYKLRKEISFKEFMEIFYGLQQEWRPVLSFPETQLRQKFFVVQLTDPARTTMTVSNTVFGLNAALFRASSFTEDSHKLLAGDELFGNRAHGHDLKGEDLKKFIEAREHEVVTTKNPAELGRLGIEQDYFDLVVKPLLKAGENFVLIAAATDASSAGALTHEIYHAKLFVEPAFKEAIQDYWFNHMTDEARDAWRKAAAADEYDPKNEELMYNEFQAYTLEENTELLNADYPDEMAAVHDHIAPLKKFLKEKGQRLLE